MPLRMSSKPIGASSHAVQRQMIAPALRPEKGSQPSRPRQLRRGRCRLSFTSVSRRIAQSREANMLWIIIVGLVAGFIARVIAPGPNNPAGFILTMALGVAGAFLATFIGHTIGWYRADQRAGFITATLAAGRA